MSEQENSKFKNPLWNLIIEIILFLIFFGFIAGIIFGIYYLTYGLDWIFDNLDLIMYIYFYPGLLISFIIWVQFIKKKDIREFLLGMPKIPKKGQQWFYGLYFITVVGITITYIILLTTGIIIIRPNDPHWILYFFYTVFGAGIVEELIFRGYLYSRSEEIYGPDRHYIVWAREEYDDEGQSRLIPVMTFEITYAAILSSVFFGLYHLPYLSLHVVATFFAGFVACKFRNEWDSLIPGMVLHGSYNGWLYFANVSYFSAEVVKEIPILLMVPIVLLLPAVIVLIVLIPFIINFVKKKLIK